MLVSFSINNLFDLKRAVKYSPGSNIKRSNSNKRLGSPCSMFLYVYVDFIPTCLINKNDLLFAPLILLC